MQAIYRPTAVRTIGYKRGQVGAGFFYKSRAKIEEHRQTFRWPRSKGWTGFHQ